MQDVEKITMTPIGVVHCGLRELAETPKNYSESSVTGSLEIFPPYLEAMEGIVTGRPLVVLFWFARARRDILKVHPRGDHGRKRRGVFTTRSPARPNPVAISELMVLGVRDNLIEVSGLDVIDGTPIVDIKSVVKPTR
ncbi:MAG: tRNA (N6-threonylcarbamoyladenosine(37)-N6)-methyltransferase TrmO [Desulfurivibrio sp.]|nr:tRNA (N6-threonylcarbamoyladenosine(37)-N6)-methyltransferase TrmO [Desulfurivibrio sp.]